MSLSGKWGRTARRSCSCNVCLPSEGTVSRPFSVAGPKGHCGSCKVFVVVIFGTSNLQGTVGEFSGLLSPYNGRSLRKFLIDHSELEALTDYLLCYTVQLTKPESGEQALFSKAGGEWVALTSRATSRPGRHSQTRSRV